MKNLRMHVRPASFVILKIILLIQIVPETNIRHVGNRGRSIDEFDCSECVKIFSGVRIPKAADKIIDMTTIVFNWLCGIISALIQIGAAP
jgi:hypothetical protein